jgi:hypothetical protein
MKALLTFAPEKRTVNPQTLFVRMLVMIVTGFVLSTNLMIASSANEPALGTLPIPVEWVECVESSSAIDLEGEELPESEALEDDFEAAVLILLKKERTIEATRDEHPVATELHLPPPEGSC